MTAGFLAFGAGVTAFAVADLRRSTVGPAWIAAASAGLATVGVALTPFGPGQSDAAHWVLAGAGYVGVTLTPLLAVPRSRWAMAAGGVAVVTLVASVASGGDASGLFQRAGLTAAHAWIVASAVGSLTTRASLGRGRTTARPAGSR